MTSKIKIKFIICLRQNQRNGSETQKIDLSAHLDLYGLFFSQFEREENLRVNVEELL